MDEIQQQQRQCTNNERTNEPQQQNWCEKQNSSFHVEEWSEKNAEPTN